MPEFHGNYTSFQGIRTYMVSYHTRLELDESEEAIQALRNLVLLVGSLTTCGFTEIKPNQASSGSLFQIPGFSLPQPMGKGRWAENQ